MSKHLRYSLAVAFAAFVLLGFPDGLLSVAWPSASRSVNVSIGWLGYLMIPFSIGFFFASSGVGSLVVRFGYARSFSLGVAGMMAGLSGFAMVPVFQLGFPALLAANLLIGFGAGILDSGLNAYAAHYFRPKHTNWLHASYGLGASAGPLVMTAVLTLTGGWHWGYAVGLIPGALVLLGFLLAGAAIRRTAEEGDSRHDAELPHSTEHPAGVVDGTAERTPSPAAEGYLAAPVVLSVVLFFLYTGSEVLIGQWVYSLLTLHLGVAEVAAGVIVGGYWIWFTIGRVGFGILSERVSVGAILRQAMIAMVIGSGLLLLVPYAGPLLL